MQRKDSTLIDIMRDLNTKPDFWMCQDGIFVLNGRICVLNDEELKEQILGEKLTKIPRFLLIKDTTTLEKVAKLYIKEII